MDSSYTKTTLRLPINTLGYGYKNDFVITQFDFSFGSTSYVYTKHLRLYNLPTDSTIVNYSENKDYLLRGNTIQLLGHNYTIKSYTPNRIELETRFKSNERIQFSPSNPNTLYYDIDSMYYERFVLQRK